MNIKFVVRLLFLFIPSIGFSQFTPMTTTIKTPHGNVPFTTYRYTPMPLYGQGNPSSKYDFRIILKNDSSFTDYTRINISDGEDHSLTIKYKRTKHEIFPKDTKSISRTMTDGSKLTGIPADSCWLFKAVKGRINGYSALAEMKAEYVIAIQNGDDQPIVPLTKENLLPMVITNQKAVVLVREKRLRRAIAVFNKEARKVNHENGNAN